MSPSPRVILGLNEFFHDTAAAVVVEGRLAALVEQERLDRRKHAPGFALGGPPPWEAIEWCLAESGLAWTDVDRIALSFDADTLRALGILASVVRGNLERTPLRNTLHHRMRLQDPALRFLDGLTVGMARRRRFLRRLSRRCRAPVTVVDHHRAHAASAFFPSGFSRAAVLVLDGMGDATPTSIWIGREGSDQGGSGPRARLDLRWLEPRSHQSLGILYRTLSLALGFSFMDAGKTMGLAAYGRPRRPYTHVLRPTEQGYHIDWPLVRRLVGGLARTSGELRQVHRDLAASLQDRLEATGEALAQRALALARTDRICLAGGVALNCNMNSRIRALPQVNGLFVQPGAMDMGGALGAALWESVRAGHAVDRSFSVYTGPGGSEARIDAALRNRGCRVETVSDPAVEAAERLARGQVVAWFQGRMEFGPRALGARSILAHPGTEAMRDRVNRIKQREPWRPLAPSIRASRMGDWFSTWGPSPHMTLTFPFRPEVRERVAGVIHVDGTARVQSVSEADHPLFHRLLCAFEDRTGLPLVLNTSFNRRGEPIVCTPEQALDTFLAGGADALVMGSRVVEAP